MAGTTLELRIPDTHDVHVLEGDFDHQRLNSLNEAQSALVVVTKQKQLRVLLAAFFGVFLTIGLNQSYGVFYNYYLTVGSSHVDPFLPKSETRSKALLAFVGTLGGAGLTWGGSIFVNPIMARTNDMRWITGVGAMLVAIGYVLASFCDRVCSARRYSESH